MLSSKRLKKIQKIRKSHRKVRFSQHLSPLKILFNYTTARRQAVSIERPYATAARTLLLHSSPLCGFICLSLSFYLYISIRDLPRRVTNSRHSSAEPLFLLKEFYFNFPPRGASAFSYTKYEERPQKSISLSIW
jgi:hypothetical protein